MSSRNGWSWMRGDGELISSSPSKSSVASDSDASLVDLQEDYELLLLKDDTPASPVKVEKEVVSEGASHEKQQQPAKVEPTPPAPTTPTADCRKSKNQGIADFRELVEQKLKKELPPAKTKVVAEQRQAFFSKFFGKMFGASSTTEKNKYKVNKEVDVTPVLEKLVQANEQKNSEGVVAKGKKKMGEKAEELNDIKDELIAFIRSNADKLIAQLKEATKQADAQTKEKVAIICAQIKDVSNRAIAWIQGHFLVLRGKVIDGFLLYFNFMDKLAAQCYDLLQVTCSTSVLCAGSKCAKRCRMMAEGTVDKLKTARVNMLGGAAPVVEAAVGVEEKRGDSSSETEEEKNYVKLEKEEEDSCMKGAEAAENVGGRGDVGAASVRKAAKDLKKRARRACTQRVKASKKSARAFRKCLLRAKHKTFGNLTKMRIALTRTVFRHSGILDDEDRRVCQIHEIQDDDFLNGNNDDCADIQDLRKTIRESLKKTSTKTTAFMNSLRAAKTSFADGATKVPGYEELQTSEGGSTNNSTRTYSSRAISLLARKFSDFFAGCSGGVTSGTTTTAFQHRLLGTMSLGSCCVVQKNKGPFHAVAFLVLLLALQSRLLLLSVVVDAPDDYDNYGYFGLMGGRQGSSSLMYDPHTGVCPLKKRNLLSLLMNGKDEVTTSAIGGKGSWFAPSDLSAFRAALFGVQQCPVEKLWAHSRPEPSCYWSTATSYKAARPATDEDDEKAFTTSADNHNYNKVSEKPHARLQAKKRGDKFMLKPRSSNSNSSAASIMYGPAGFAVDFANKSVFSIMRDYVKSKLGFSSNSFAYRNATSTNVQKLSEEAVPEATVQNLFQKLMKKHEEEKIAEHHQRRVLNNYRRGASHFYRGSMRRGYVGGPKVRGSSQSPYARRSRFNAASHNFPSSNKMQILLDQEMLNLKLAEEEKAQSEQAVPAVLFVQMEKPLYGPANDMHNSRIQLAKSLVLYQNPSLSVRDFSDEQGYGGTCGYANSDLAKRFRKVEALRVRARKMKAAPAEEKKALRAPRRQMARRSGPSNKVVDVFCSAQGFCGYAEQLNDNGISGSFSPRPQPSAASEHSYYPLINVPIPTPVPFPAPTVQHVRDYSLRRPSSASRRSTFTTSTTTAAVMFPKLSQTPSHGTYLPAPFSVEYRQQLQAARDSRAVGVYFSGKPVSSSKRGKKWSTSQVGQKKQKLVSSTLTEVESDRANFTSLLRNYSLSPKTSTSLVPNMSLSVAPKHLFRNATDMLISRRTTPTPAPTTKLTLTTAGPGLSPTFFMPTNYPMPLMRMQSDSSNPSSRKRYRRFIFPSSPQLGRGAGNNYESENGGQCPSYEGPLYLDSQMPGSENVPVRNITAAREAYMKVIGLE